METKKTLKFFSIVEYQKEQEYLRKMHQSGWKFVKVSGFCIFHFEKCVPEDVIYQLDYNQDGIAHKNEYVKMFNDCGWEYLQDYMGYSYFRKAASETTEAEEIFCDDNSRSQMLERIYKGRLLPLVILFFSVLIPQFINSITIYKNGFVTAVLGVVIGLYISIFFRFAFQYWKYKRRK